MIRRPIHTLLAVGGFFACLVAAQPPAQPSWLVGGGILALWLELSAPFLPGVGFMSLGAACYLGLACLDQVGPTAAALLALVALLMRTLWRGSRQAELRLDELLVDAIPTALALFAIVASSGSPPGLGRLLVALTLYTGALVVTAASIWGAANLRVRSVRTVQIMLLASAAGALGLSPQTPAAGLLAIPLLLLPPILGPRLGLAHHTANMVELERASAQRSLSSVMERLDSLRQEQQTRASELELFRRFASSFAESPDLQSTVALLKKEASRLGKPDSIAIFLVRDGRLEPVSYRTPDAQRIARLGRANLKEPVVEQCLRERGHVWKKPGPSTGQEMLPASEHGVAFPLDDQGALYLGWRSAPSLPSESLRSLLALVDLSSVAIETAARLDKVRHALDYHYSGHTQARAWLDRFDVLLAGVRSLAGHFSSDQVLDTLRELALRLVAHDHGVIVIRLAGRERVLCWPTNDSLDVAAIEPIGRAAIERQQPLMLEPGSGFAPVWSKATAHLAAPVMADNAALGVIVVAREQGAFERTDQESLALAAVQTAIMLDNCRLYEEVLDSKARLEQSQAQLVQSSKLAAVGQLAAGVAHELNTPLGAILLRIDTARRNLEKNDPVAADKKLQSARDALLAARDIVGKLLTYSANDSRQMAQCDLGQVVGNALALVEAQFAQQNVKVSLGQGCSARILGHANELTQVVVNLLLNARDAILSAHPEGHIQIRSETSPTHVRLEVEDSGPGIPDEVRPRIFDPFFTTKPVGSGTGLGLWISHQIMETHGGRMTVSEGSPTRFVLELPRAG